jgi:crotonobetainyl-CoA:carnitine CoA-transferase CaiB-like acyl-CoA transferase
MGATGVGQHIDVSKQEALMTMVRVELPMFANEGEVRRRHKTGGHMPSLLECQDGYIVVVPQERKWQDVVKSVGNPPGDNHDRIAQWVDRDLPDNELALHVREWVRQFKKEDLFHQLQINSVACAPVNTVEDMVSSPQIRERGFFVEIEHPEAGNLKYPTAAYKLSETPWRAERAAPLLGQHNETVYCGRLGYSKHDLAKMKESGII